jgi:hypothetical protein
MCSEGDEDANDWDHESCRDPGYCMRLECVEFHPAKNSYFNWKIRSMQQNPTGNLQENIMK